MPTPSTPSPTPPWVPPGVTFEELPAILQDAFTTIITPAYVDLVLGAANTFERTAALSYIHMIWVELVEQLSFDKDLEANLASGSGTKGLEERITQLLRVVNTKDKTARLLLQMHKFFERVGNVDPPQSDSLVI